MNYDKILGNILVQNNRISKLYWKFLNGSKKGKYPNIYNYIINRYDDISDEKIRLKETAYRMLKGVDKRPVCPICGKPTKFNIQRENCFNYHCSVKCEMANEKVKDKLKATCLEKYGTDNPAKSNKVKEKAKATCIERYGVDNAAKTKASKDKAKSTNIERYGCVCAIQNEEVKKKTRATNLKRYGNEIAQQNEEIKQKISDSVKRTCLKKYGVTSSMKLDSTKESSKITNMKKYGVPNVSQNQNIQQKRLNTLVKNETYIKSNLENKSYELIKEIYPDVIRQYRSELYPFYCDFYVPSLDLYIECHYHWAHGEHQYDSNNKEDQEKLKILIENSKHIKYYSTIIKTWTILDPKKLKTAQDNNLNYLMFYSFEEFELWAQNMTNI